MADRCVIVDSPEIAARGEELFPKAVVLYANGKLPSEALAYPDAVIISKDLDRITTFGAEFAAAQCKKIRFANADISLFNRSDIENLGKTGQIHDYKPSAPQESSPAADAPLRAESGGPAGAEPSEEAPERDLPLFDLSADPDEDERAETALRSIRTASALKSAEHDAQTSEWPEPGDFWGAAPLPEFRPEFLPPQIEPYCTDQADRAGVDPAQVALNCYVICAAMIRTGIELQMQADGGEDGRTWRERPILWGATVGDPSTGKGPAMDIAMHKPQKLEHAMRLQDAAAWERYEEEAKIYEKRMQSYISEAANAKNGPVTRPEAPEKPPRNRLFIDDATKEVVAKILTENPRGKIAVLKDELAGWFGSFGAYGATGAEKDRGDWLSFYESKQKWIDRSTEGRSYHVESWGGCILGGIQPEVLSRIASKLGADGMLQRFMIVISKPKQRVPSRPADADAVKRWNRILENLVSMSSTGASVRLSPEAAEYMDTQTEWISSAMQSGIPPSLVSALGKWEGLFGRLMITSHCIACADAGMPFPAAEVTLSVAQQCWGWMRYVLWPHAVHFYSGMADQDEALRDMRAFADYILARDIHMIVTTSLGRNWSRYRTGFKTIQQRREFWANAQQCGWVRPLGIIERNQGITSRYEVNPAVFDGRFAEQAEKAKQAAERYRLAMHPAMVARMGGRQPGED